MMIMINYYFVKNMHSLDTLPHMSKSFLSLSLVLSLCQYEDCVLQQKLKYAEEECFELTLFSAHS